MTIESGLEAVFSYISNDRHNPSSSHASLNMIFRSVLIAIHLLLSLILYTFVSLLKTIYPRLSMTTEIQKPETCVQNSAVSTALPPSESRTSDKTDETTNPTSSAQPSVSISNLDGRSLVIGTNEHVSAAQLQDDTPTPTPEHCGNDAKDGTCMTKQQFEHEVAEREQLELDLRNLRTELNQKEKELLNVRRRWKQAAKELDKTKSSQQRGLHHKTDSEVKDDVAQLRWNIRNLAFGYFGGEYKISVRPEDLTTKIWQSLLSFLDYGLDVDSFLRSGAVRPLIIQALIWDVIDTRIFHNALWAGPVSSAFVRLIRRIAPGKRNNLSIRRTASVVFRVSA